MPADRPAGNGKRDSALTSALAEAAGAHQELRQWRNRQRTDFASLRRRDHSSIATLIAMVN